LFNEVLLGLRKLNLIFDKGTDRMKEVNLIDVKGVGLAKVKVLEAHGIDSVEKLANTALSEICKIPGFAEALTKTLQKNAQDLLAASKNNTSSTVKTAASKTTAKPTVKKATAQTAAKKAIVTTKPKAATKDIPLIDLPHKPITLKKNLPKTIITSPIVEKAVAQIADHKAADAEDEVVLKAKKSKSKSKNNKGKKKYNKKKIKDSKDNKKKPKKAKKNKDKSKKKK